MDRISSEYQVDIKRVRFNPHLAKIRRDRHKTIGRVFSRNHNFPTTRRCYTLPVSARCVFTRIPPGPVILREENTASVVNCSSKIPTCKKVAFQDELYTYQHLTSLPSSEEVMLYHNCNPLVGSPSVGSRAQVVPESVEYVMRPPFAVAYILVALADELIDDQN